MVAGIYESKDKILFEEVQKLINGNFDSYEQVYELSKKYIYKIINDVVQNHYTTEDLMQETYLQVYRKINTLKEAKAFYVWAGRIATNLSLRHIQKYRKEVPYAQVVDDETEDSGTIFDKAENDHEEFIPETVLTNTEQQRIIAEILESLSPEQKLCVQYYYYEEMSVNDIANLMQCSTGTVKSRLNYARKSLKEAINTFEIKNDTKLYGLATLPVFFFAFKKAADIITFAGATAVGVGSAAVAGGVAVENAAVGSGAVAGGSAATGGGVAAGSSAVAGAGTVTATTGGGFLATVVGKVAVVATAVCVSTGTAAISTEIAKTEMEKTQGHVITYEEARQELLQSNVDINSVLGYGTIDSTYSLEEKTTSNLETVLGTNYAITDAELAAMDEDYVAMLDNMAASMLELEAALDYALTPEQALYMDGVMGPYFSMLEAAVQEGKSYSSMPGDETQERFDTVYAPRMINCYNNLSEVLSDTAAIYNKSEVKQAFAQYSAQDLQVVMESGNSAIALVASDLPEEIINEIVATNSDLNAFLDEYMAILNDMAADPAFAEYFQQMEEEMSSMLEDAGY